MHSHTRVSKKLSRCNLAPTLSDMRDGSLSWHPFSHLSVMSRTLSLASWIRGKLPHPLLFFLYLASTWQYLTCKSAGKNVGLGRTCHLKKFYVNSSENLVSKLTLIADSNAAFSFSDEHFVLCTFRCIYILRFQLMTLILLTAPKKKHLYHCSNSLSWILYLAFLWQVLMIQLI